MDNPSLKSKVQEWTLEEATGDRIEAWLAAHGQTAQKEQAYRIEASLTRWDLRSQNPGKGN